ncbi:MAG: valine--tRNA ligase [Dehalococcoidia bacterium]
MVKKQIEITEIPKVYDFQSTENRIYNRWKDIGAFEPNCNSDKEPFTIIMPPPNVTGELHMGHALTLALEDLMVRWHRMLGHPTLYLPGTDHAGIATQMVVERNLASQGISRHDLGREKFVNEIWDWVEKYGNKINEQIERLGTSCDWSRSRFTLDEGPALAVKTTFVKLYQTDQIYRGDRITNWCPRCRTALSDLEVKYVDQKSSLYHIRYPIQDSENYIVVATTRPETMLADTAVAVNPEDERYQKFSNKTILLPIMGREIPIISDESVDMTFGTGALKVTPGHSLTDYEIGQRNNLEIINVLNLDGTLNENASHYQGIDRLDARNSIIEELSSLELLELEEPYNNSVGQCDRCQETVEPIVTPQWYVRTEKLAKRAAEAVENNEIEIIPSRFKQDYLNWMDNIRDWCISRQLWWGHRIPVWHCNDCNEVTVEISDPKYCAHCQSKNLFADPDVLDTWFSSALWPHSTLGWPEDTQDLNRFYPTTVLETGYDILFFWVARMVMMGLENTNKIPFKTIYLHGLVLDPEGIKMSKTKGNVLDPLQLIDLYGADALRFALTTGNSPGNNQRMNEQKLEASRNFANKLWNIARFVITNISMSEHTYEWNDKFQLTHIEDQWIVSRLNNVIKQSNLHMKRFQFGEAQRIIHDFVWNEFADWYIEMVKIRLRDELKSDKNLKVLLIYILENILRLLHPFMPFITEELWQIITSNVYSGSKTNNRPEYLINCAYPEYNADQINEKSENTLTDIFEIIRAIRNVRAEFRILPNQFLDVSFSMPSFEESLRSEIKTIKYLARLNEITFNLQKPATDNNAITIVMKNGTIIVPLSEFTDIEGEISRLKIELNDCNENIEKINIRLLDNQFMTKAPEEIIERERVRLSEIQDRKEKIQEILSNLNG